MMFPIPKIASIGGHWVVFWTRYVFADQYEQMNRDARIALFEKKGIVPEDPYGIRINGKSYGFNGASSSQRYTVIGRPNKKHPRILARKRKNAD